MEVDSDKDSIPNFVESTSMALPKVTGYFCLGPLCFIKTYVKYSPWEATQSGDCPHSILDIVITGILKIVLL